MKPGIRKGILPTILAALIQARSATRQLLKETDDAAQRSVLESRQKALKLTANALYGFTGAPCKTPRHLCFCAGLRRKSRKQGVSPQSMYSAGAQASPLRCVQVRWRSGSYIMCCFVTWNHARNCTTSCIKEACIDRCNGL